MAEPTLESLAKRVEELERKVAELTTPHVKDWRSVVGMFERSEFTDIWEEECRKIREADREEARREFGDEP